MVLSDFCWVIVCLSVIILVNLCEKNPCALFASPLPIMEPDTDGFKGIGVDGRELGPIVPLPNAVRARTAAEPVGICLVDNFLKS